MNVKLNKSMKKFNIRDIKKFLIQTGFPFEMKMAKILENKDYSVQVGEFFTDLEDDKKREIDIIAYKGGIARKGFNTGSKIELNTIFTPSSSSSLDAYPSCAVYQFLHIIYKLS